MATGCSFPPPRNLYKVLDAKFQASHDIIIISLDTLTCYIFIYCWLVGGGPSVMYIPPKVQYITWNAPFPCKASLPVCQRAEHQHCLFKTFSKSSGAGKLCSGCWFHSRSSPTLSCSQYHFLWPQWLRVSCLCTWYAVVSVREVPSLSWTDISLQHCVCQRWRYYDSAIRGKKNMC